MTDEIFASKVVAEPQEVGDAERYSQNQIEMLAETGGARAFKHEAQRVLAALERYAEQNGLVLHAKPRIEWELRVSQIGYRWPDGTELSQEDLRRMVERVPPTKTGSPIIVDVAPTLRVSDLP